FELWKRWRRATAGRSGHLDVFPKAEALGNRLHRGQGSLIGPRRALMTRAPDHHVIELNPMRTGAIGGGLGGLFEPLHMHRGAREIVVSAVLNDVVALGDHMVLQHGLHFPFSYFCSLLLPGHSQIANGFL